MASPMAIDTSLTPSQTAGSTFDYVILNIIKNEMVSKFNAMLSLTTGHNHDGANSRSLSGGGYSLKEIEAMIIMGVYE